MSWVTPGTFTNGAALTAANLNLLRDDIIYLNGLTDYINTPFFQYTYGVGGDQAMSEYRWRFHHRFQYLHYYLSIDAAPGIDPTLFLYGNWGSGDTVLLSVSDGGLLENGDVLLGAIDLTSHSIAVNTWMTVWWSANCNGLATARYLLESSVGTIV